ncbi:hypothetical protein TRFO_39205 [Tritrichomonas foetus]|uniref:Uncharacterized protein n=1 Tax=Tritrichomonas foetus TaxID=1144522 RepID=A0A1J4J7L4_9EUKA|nr:hypothetical protein TRFO_39205 [Tritrichomonas foetus]|eukprot:OHS94649.1 hypothetical protein TRFO_39205 [Tritrichomonas foetus]
MHNPRRLSPPPRGPRIHTRQLSDSPASQFSDRINNFIIAKNPADIVSKFDSSKRKTDIENIEITEKDFSLNKMRNEFRTLASTVSRSLKQKDSSSFRRVDSDIFSTLLPFSSMEFQNDSFFRNKIISNENSEDEDLKTNYVSSVNSNKNILNNENVDKNAKQTNFQNHQINSFQIDNKQNEIEIETSSSTSIYSDTVPYRPCQTPFAVNHTEIDCFPENNQKDEHNSKLYLKIQSPNPKKLNTPNDSIHNDSIHSDSIHSDSIHSDSIHIALIAEDHSNAEENDFIFELFPYFKNISRKKVVKLDEKIFNDFENENETNKNKFIIHEPRYKEKGKFIIKSSELFVTPPQHQINNDNTEFTHQQQNFHSNPNDEEVEIVRGKLKGEEKSKESAIKKENTMSLTEKEIDENEQSYNTSQECELSDNAPLINKISSQNIKNQKKNESSSFSLEYDEFIDVLTNSKKEAKKRHNDFESDKKISKSNIIEPGSNNENPDEENNLKDLYLNTKNNESNVFDQRNIHSHNNKKTISIHEHSIPTNFPNNTDQKINFKQFPFERQLGNKQESEQGSYDNNSPQNNENASNSKAYNYDHYRNQKLPMVMLSTSSFQVGEDFRSNKEDITDYDISSNTSTPFHDESPLIEEEENFTEGENNTESNKGQKEKHLLENNVFTFPIPPSFLCNQLFPKTIRNPIKITAKYEDPQKNKKFIFIHNDNENQVKSETTLETNGNYENQEKSRGTFLMAKSRYFDDFDGVLRFIKTEHPEFSEEPPFQDINVGYIRSLLWINNTSNLISDPSQDSSAISLVVNNVISYVDNINNEGQINRTLIHEESLKEMPRERNTDTHLQSYESEKSNISKYFTDFEFEYKRRKTPLVLSISLNIICTSKIANTYFYSKQTHI